MPPLRRVLASRVRPSSRCPSAPPPRVPPCCTAACPARPTSRVGVPRLPARDTHLGARSSSCGRPGSSQLERPPSSAAPGVPGRPYPKEKGLTLKTRLGRPSKGLPCRAPLTASLELNCPSPLPPASVPGRSAGARTWDAAGPTGSLGASAAPERY